MMRRPSRFGTTSRLFSPTPPPSHSSDDSFPGSNGLLGTCRTLQSLLNGTSPAPSPRRAKPKQKRLQSPVQIRSAPSRKVKVSGKQQQKLSTTTTATATTPDPPRGANKRRRDVYEDNDGDIDMVNEDSEEREGDNNTYYSHNRSRNHNRFSTPKRRRHAPFDLPLGLSEDDFYSIHTPPSLARWNYHHQEQHDQDCKQSLNLDPDSAVPSIEEVQEEEEENLTFSETDAETETDTDTAATSFSTSTSIQTEPEPDKSHPEWTTEDDQVLVNLVLEKFQLSQRDWQECARHLGKDDASVGRRWQALVGEGNVGLMRRRGSVDERWL